MKTLLLLLSLAFAGVSYSQTLIPSDWNVVIDTASTSWDSVYVGQSSQDKILEVCNDGSVPLYVANNNDTTATSANKKTFDILLAGEKNYYGIVRGISYVKIKAASSTCAYRVKRKW